MATVFRDRPIRTIQERAFGPGLTIMALVVIVTLMVIALNSDLTLSLPYLYLLPWIIGLFVVLLLPTVVLHFRGKLTLYDPLVFATWVYFFPSFVIGGLMVTAGWSQPYFLSFIQDARYNLPYTVVLIMLGFGGLALGYFSPIGSRTGKSISEYLPKFDFDASAMVVPGILLLVFGIFNSVVALALGIIGYQKGDATESYDGIVFLTTLFWMQGMFLLCFVIFRKREFNLRSVFIVALLFTASMAKAVFSGNRAGLLQVFIIVTLAFLLAGRKLSFKQTAFAGLLLGVCLIAGTIYAATFRSIKGSESQVSIEQYTESVFDTFDQFGRFDLQNTLHMSLLNLAERLDTLSSVAVVVSTYEQLQPYEESYGLDNNIWKDISTFFVPRVIWNDKPVASEPRKYSDLYFDYGANSFAITPIGDLVRNYGPVGVPIGMFLFGILIRFIYRALIEDQPLMIWRATLYFMLLMSISYEGFYGLLIPFLVKVGITSIVGLIIVGLVARGMGHKSRLVDA